MTRRVSLGAVALVVCLVAFVAFVVTAPRSASSPAPAVTVTVSAPPVTVSAVPVSPAASIGPATSTTRASRSTHRPAPETTPPHSPASTPSATQTPPAPTHRPSPPAPAASPSAPRAPPATASIPAVWRALVECEAPIRLWRYGAPGVGIDPGYPFEGGPNFEPSTWDTFGGREFARHAYDATPAEQVTVARRVLAAQGPHAWPQCGPRVGLQRGD